MSAGLAHLERLYAAGDDPWQFRTSPYEAAKFAATVAALPRPRYGHALELGCGNGELARRVVTRCAAYTGIDAVETPLIAARVAVPTGTFLQALLPCRLPAGPYDLIVLSEFLYFLSRTGIGEIAGQIDRRWPDADVLVVSWLGSSGHNLDGEAALGAFSGASGRNRISAVAADPRHRIDVFAPVTGSAVG